ncbi:MAG: macro domain-containing protein [Candidatus Caldarchaeum sp.]
MASHLDRIKLSVGDITLCEVDAIVNAANTSLLLGSGVAGAIRKRGGEEIQIECSQKAPASLGEAVVTCGGKLQARYVIHAAAMHLGGKVTEESLRSATKNSLIRADELGIGSIAFPAIGTGVGGFPIEECAKIMIDTVLAHPEEGKSGITCVYFVLFDERSYRAFEQYLDTRAPT